jgi:hypothetical protein
MGYVGVIREDASEAQHNCHQAHGFHGFAEAIFELIAVFERHLWIRAAPEHAGPRRIVVVSDPLRSI